MKKFKNYDVVMEYANSIVEERKIAGEYIEKGAERFLRDLKNPDYEFNPKDAEFVIGIIETTFVHMQGEKLDGTPLRGMPFLLEPFHKFQVYNMLGFFHKGTKIRRYKEAFIFIPRKNIKTSFAAALAWALGLLQRKSGSKVYITSAALKQSMESFNFINFNLGQMGEKQNFRVIDNNQEHSITAERASWNAKQPAIGDTGWVKLAFTGGVSSSDCYIRRIGDVVYFKGWLISPAESYDVITLAANFRPTLDVLKVVFKDDTGTSKANMQFNADGRMRINYNSNTAARINLGAVSYAI